MRQNGTIYPEIKKLPASAMPVSRFAKANDMQVGHVYMKFKRFRDGKSTNDPKYKIVQFQGTNYVIPD